MHEVSICESLLQQLEQQAVEKKFSQICTIWLEIGPLAGVELEALRFSFEAVARHSLAETARLEIIETKASAWCSQCEQTITITQRYDVCPNCAHYPLAIRSGDELRIKQLEVN